MCVENDKNTSKEVKFTKRKKYPALNASKFLNIVTIYSNNNGMAFQRY